MEQVRKRLLINWLRGKGFHPTDTAYAIKRWEEGVAAGTDMKDEEVLALAEESHALCMDRYKGEIPDKVYEVRVKASFWGAFIGGVGSFILMEVVRWVLGLMR